MKKFYLQIITIAISSFFSLTLFAGDEPSLEIFGDKTGNQFELCWLPGEKPSGTLTLNGNAIAVKGGSDCIKTSIVKAAAPYSFEIDGKVYKYSAGGAYIFTNPTKITAGKAGKFFHTFTFGTNELPSAGLSTMSLNGTSYPAVSVSANSYRLENVPTISGKMVVKAASKTFIYASQSSNTIVPRTPPTAKIMSTGEVELEWEPNETPDNLSKVRIGGVDYAGSVVSGKFVTTAKTFTAQLGHKLVMNMKGATRSFNMAPTPGALATLLPREAPTTKLVASSTPTCGNMELTWADPLEVPQNLKTVEVNGINYSGLITGGKFTTNHQVDCATDGDYNMRIRDYDDPVTHSEILPIQLSSFNAKYVHNEKVNVIDWVIQTAENVSSYELLRSFDGKYFEQIHGVRVGGDAGYGTFQFVDKTVPFKYSGHVYYRLRNTDIDGSVQLHKIAAVFFKGRAIETEISIYPNPAKNFVNINTEVKGKLLIFSQLGKIVFEGDLEEGSTEIDLQELSSGAYFGKFIDENGSSKTLNISVAR